MSQLRNPDDIPAVPTDAEVRVRFAPSPPPTPHVGPTRPSLSTWGWARHTGGKMIFRVEDTDTKRDSEESYQQLLDAMAWMGIDWDEGVEVGGPHEPYRQSQRGEIYQQVIQQLKDGGYIYPSYTTAEETEARHLAAGRDQKLGYDGYDRTLTEAQIAEFEAAGRKPVWRLRMPDHDLSFNDTIRGPITFSAGSVADFVVVRADGSPLYTLVNPVDDAFMGVTHVLRGEDLLSSTPRQIALYRALYAVGVADFQPTFGHLPYVMGQGNKKLSKRDPQSSLFHHRENGFIREGLLNYLALLGWSLSADEDIFTPEEFVEHFDIHTVLANPARFDEKKAIRSEERRVGKLDAEDFRNRLIPYLQDRNLVGEKLTDRETDILAQGAPLVQERVHLLGEAADMLAFLFTETVEVEQGAMKGMPQNLAEVLTAAENVLADLETWDLESIEAGLRTALIDELELKPRHAFGPVRTAVSGRRVSPPLFESLVILGRETSLERISQFRQTNLSSSSSLRRR